jgi:hypothetical protein
VQGATGTAGTNGTNGATGASGATGPDFLIFSSGSSVAANATVYVGAAAANATETNVQQVVPVTKTYTNLYCFGPKPTGAASDVFTVRDNGSSTTATCTVPSGGTSVVTSAINLTINAGDLVDVRVANGNTAGGVTAALAP